MLAATGLSSGVALGQEGGAALEEIVITGTRIANPNAVSSSPVLAVTQENLKLQGIVDAGDLIDNLPQNVSVAAVDLSNTTNPLSGPGGVTTMNLRGLGPQRTLVLVDGRRLGVGDPNSGNPNPAPDINQIPAALIERVDIVTGGASAVYGSDAIAGVVNFIMRRDFEGVQIDAQYGFNWHENRQQLHAGPRGCRAACRCRSSNVTDGDELAVSVVVGGNFADGKGNVTGYLSYIDAQPTRLSERDFSACQLAGQGTTCGGSTNSNYFEVLDGPGSRAACSPCSATTSFRLGHARHEPAAALQLQPVHEPEARPRAVPGRRVRQVRVEREGDAVHRLHVHEGPGANGGRAVGPVHRQPDPRVLQQPVAERPAAGGNSAATPA